MVYLNLLWCANSLSVALREISQGYKYLNNLRFSVRRKVAKEYLNY